MQFLDDQAISSVLLTGDPNTNFIASYATLLRAQGFEVFFRNQRSLGSKKDFDFDLKNLSSQKISNSRNYTLTFENSKPFEELFAREQYRYLMLSRWGIFSPSLLSLESLWKEIQIEEYDLVFVDIGSGITFLSFLLHCPQFLEKIFGVAIGAKKQSLISHLENFINSSVDDASKIVTKNSSQVFEKIVPFDFLHLLDEEQKPIFQDQIWFSGFLEKRILHPIDSSSFGKSSKATLEFCNQSQTELSIPLEPIYSGKSIPTILEFLKTRNPSAKAIYIHQGL